MMNDSECLRACRAVALGERVEPAEQAWLAAHVWECAECAELDAEVLSGVRAATAGLPADDFFRAQAQRIVAAAKTEREASSSRPGAWRAVLPLALAASLALFFQLRETAEPPQPLLEEVRLSEAEMAGALQSALLAPEPFFSFSPSDDIGDLSDAELDDMHELFGDHGLG